MPSGASPLSSPPFPPMQPVSPLRSVLLAESAEEKLNPTTAFFTLFLSSPSFTFLRRYPPPTQTHNLPFIRSATTTTKEQTVAVPLATGRALSDRPFFFVVLSPLPLLVFWPSVSVYSGSIQIYLSTHISIYLRSGLVFGLSRSYRNHVWPC